MMNDINAPPVSGIGGSVLFSQNFFSTAQVTVNQGGTSSGKTYAIEQVLFCLACQTSKLVITIVAQDVPNLKVGALRDALNIYQESTALQGMVKGFNKTDRVFEFNNGSIIEFKSYDNAQDAKSGKRDYLFVNEANGITWDVYHELALRTKRRIFIDYNPNTGFWVHEKLIGQPNVQLIISDHRHNPYLGQAIRDKIESLKNDDMELWKVYARGLTGKITGLIFNNWYLCNQIPDDARLIAAGLDFGFTNDQTGCLLVYRQNGELWVNELFYETGLTNADIADRLKACGVSKGTEIIADSAEPKSIEDLKRMGWYITGAKKGADSIKNSIDILKRYKINITRNSVNLRNELNRYKWRIDQSGKTINQPVDKWNHLIDPLRYVALNKLKINNEGKLKSRLPFVPRFQSATGVFEQMINGS
ncbi:phage terminase large subunit [Mucilaginibacter lappiensis]|uniref:Phage terminase large subunit n=1 Tax=Mucilaginibacter lappiensis TaxID=354630 RepID=A0ABR6PGR0_9SPHI|nr:terminase large subunit [Mucilaginibacter lappiensis]MBB6108956.1 phage terminase large subunit [Mucilaginibacter lappiensis]SIQ69307.1 phage terminase large subunit [Mucilaginibacter lappiensis]